MPSAIISSPEAFANMCEALAGKSSNRLADWVSHPRASDSAEFFPIKNALLKNSASQSRSRNHTEKDATTLDALAGAALEAALGASSIAEKREMERTGELREERFLTAMDRLAESLSTFENRMIETSRAKTAEQANSEEIMWLEEDELAGKLERILKRQARRRGIDLS